MLFSHALRPLLVIAALLGTSCSASERDRPGVAGASPPGGPSAAIATAATPAPPDPPPATLTITGDVEVADASPQVVLFSSGNRLRIEIRHRAPGSAQPDSVLTLAGVPPTPGSYRLHGPGPAPRHGLTAYFTTRSERVGSMKDFTHAVAGSLTLRERGPGALVGEFRVTAEERPPSDPAPRPGEPPLNMTGRRPAPPPARIEATGTFLAVLAEVRQASLDDSSAAPPFAPGSALRRTRGDQDEGR